MTAQDESDAATAEREAAPSGAGPAEQANAHLFYRVLKLSNLIGRPFFTHFADRYDLTMNDTRVLMTLASMSEAASHEICQVSGMHPMNVSRSVARLRRQGRIVERSDPHNRRRKILTPTPEGWELYRKLTPHVNVLSEFVFGALSGLESDLLGKLVDLLTQRLEAVDLNSPQLIDVEALAQEVDAAVSTDARPRNGPRRRRPVAATAPASSRQAS
jgi:DNA-binding MarR family transcriptional regulator